MTTPRTEKIEIRIESDIVLARKAGRDMADAIGFKTIDCIKIATAISELARNLFLYARDGTITISAASGADERIGLEIWAEDSGPGIESIDLVMRDGFSTSDGLGLGLPGTRRLMDEFDIQSELGMGTRIRTAKWIPMS